MWPFDDVDTTSPSLTIEEDGVTSVVPNPNYKPPPAPTAAAIPPAVVEAVSPQMTPVGPPPPEPQQSPSVGSQFLTSLAQGTPGSPGGFRRVGYGIDQTAPGPMPGADIPEVPGTITTGPSRIPASVMAALNPEQQRAYVERQMLGKTNSVSTSTMPETARPDVDPAVLEALSPEERAAYEQTRQPVIETVGGAGVQQLSPTGEPLRPESPYEKAKREFESSGDVERLGQEQAFENRVASNERAALQHGINSTVREMDAMALQDEQKARADYIRDEVPKLAKLMDEQSRVRLTNPVKDYWANRSTGTRIIDAIALGLSTLGSGLTGAPNIVWEMIQKEIDGEVLSQKQRYEAIGNKIAGAKTLFGLMLERFKSPEAAERATRYALEMAAAEEAQRQAALESSDNAKAAKEAIADQARTAAAQNRLAALQGEVKTVWRDVPGTAGTPGWQNLSNKLKAMGVPDKERLPMMLELMNKGGEAGNQFAMNAGKREPSRSQIEATKYENATRVPLPGRFGGGVMWQLGPERAKESFHAVWNADDALENLARLRQIVKNDVRIDPNALLEISQIAATSMGQWRTSLGLGVLSDSDKKLIEPLTGESLKTMVLADRERAISNLERIVNRGTEKYLQSGYDDPDMVKQHKERIVTRAAK